METNSKINFIFGVLWESAEQQKKNKKTPNSGARGGGAGPTPRLHAPPAGPALARTRIRFFFCFLFRKRQIPQKRLDSLSTLYVYNIGHQVSNYAKGLAAKTQNE